MRRCISFISCIFCKFTSKKRCRDGSFAVIRMFHIYFIDFEYILTAIRCRQLPALDHGRVSYSSNDYDYGSVATFSCDTGYQLQGTSQRTCHEGVRQAGSWSGTQPSCHSKSSGGGSSGILVWNTAVMSQ